MRTTPTLLAPGARAQLRAHSTKKNYGKIVPLALAVLSIIAAISLGVYHVHTALSITLGTLGAVTIAITGIVAIADAAQRGIKEKELNDEAQKLGLDVNQLPKDPFEKRRYLNSVIMAKELETRRDNANKWFQQFKDLVENPNADVDPSMLPPKEGASETTHLEKMNFFWKRVREERVFEDYSLGVYPTDRGQLMRQELNQIRKEFIDLRRDSYYNQISQVTHQELINQAKDFYILLFPKGMRDQIVAGLEDPSTDLMAVVKKMVDSSKEEYKVIELDELLGELEDVDDSGEEDVFSEEI